MTDSKLIALRAELKAMSAARTPLQKALCAAGFSPTATIEQVKQAMQEAQWDMSWNHAQRCKAALALMIEAK